MKTPRFIGKQLLLACLLPLIGAPQAWAETPQQGGTLVVGAETELGTRDPAVSESGAAARVNWLVYEGLVQYDLKADTKGAPPKIVPVLAESWDVSDDHLTYTFHLRKNVMFHDGTPFNAQAVEFNVRRVWDKDFEHYYQRGAGVPANRYLHLKDVKAVDDHTVVFTLSQNNAFFIAQLAEGATPGLPSIASPETIRKYGNEELGNHPVGTGPFEVAEQAKGEYTRLVRYQDYWNKPYPYLDELIFREIPDGTTRVNALVAGEVDMIIDVPPDDVASLKEKGFNLSMGPLPHIWYLTFNVEQKPFDDKRVRQAVAMSIDKKGMIRELLQGTALPAFSMVSRTSPGFDSNWKDPHPYNVEKAKQLLAEAGYGDGIDAELEISTSGSGQMIPVAMAEWIQRDLAKIGIRAKINTFEWNTYVGRWVKGMEPTTQINQMSWGSNSDFWLQVPFQSASWGNSGHIDDPKIDALLMQMIGADDQEQRISLAQEIAERNMDEVYHLPIVSNQGTFALNPKVQGFVRSADWIEDYANIWIDRE